MESQSTSVVAFLDQLGKWSKSLADRDFQSAKYYADELRVVGKMLSTHPDFRAAFETRADEAGLPNAESALCCLHAFLLSLNDACAPRPAPRAPRV